MKKCMNEIKKLIKDNNLLEKKKSKKMIKIENK